MKRSWTDSRDQTVWTVTAVEGLGDREGSGSAGFAGETTEGLVFESGEERHAIPTERAGALEEMSGDQLQALLDTARSGPAGPDSDLRDSDAPSGRRGPGVKDPDSSGRQSAPHADPAARGSADAEP